MNFKGLKSPIEKITTVQKYEVKKKKKSEVVGSFIFDKNLSSYSIENLQANYAPVSFKGNAPKITNAYIITGEKEDLPLLVTKKNESYVIDFDSQTEIIYGVDAVRYLDQASDFHYDTQVIFPKKSEGILHIEGKKIPLSENSAVMINSGTNAKVEVKKGYPLMIISKKDYDWYERYGKDAKDLNIRNKFLELMYYNSHLYNGEFTPNVLLPEKLRDEAFLKSISIDKWVVRNDLVIELYAKKDLLNEQDRETVEFTKGLMDKLYQKQIILAKDDGYVSFVPLYNVNYMKSYLMHNGFSEKEINLLLPIYKQARQVHMDAMFSHRNPVEGYNSDYIGKNVLEMKSL